MNEATAMAADTKALLTLWLLKTGTTAAEIRVSLQLAATSRAMAAAEHGYSSAVDAPFSLAPNVSKLHPDSENDALVAAREAHLAATAMNSDIKALITLSLLKIGTSSEEIKGAIRLARTRATVAETPSDGPPAGPTPPAANSMPGASAASTPKQTIRNEHLAPIPSHGFVAA